jgi:hypothetical protein
MGKFVHLAREFFTEAEMREIFSAESYFPMTRLFDIARSRGLLLSENLSREELVNELSCQWYSWQQFENVVRYLNSTDDEEDKSSVSRVENAITYEEVEQAKNSLEIKRAEKQKQEVVINTLLLA